MKAFNSISNSNLNTRMVYLKQEARLIKHGMQELMLTRRLFSDLGSNNERRSETLYNLADKTCTI